MPWNLGLVHDQPNVSYTLVYKWANVKNDPSAIYKACATNNAGVWIVGGDDGAGTTILIRSIDDGLTWSSVATKPGSPNLTTIDAITRFKGLFVLSGSTTNGFGVFTSPDGLTWTRRTWSGSSTNTFDRHGTNGSRLAIHGGSLAAYSDNGTTWTASSTALTRTREIAYINGVWFKAQGGAAYDTETSTDGATWTASTVSLGGSTIDAFAAGDGQFLAWNGGDVYTSTNAASWSLVSSVETALLSGVPRLKFVNSEFFGLTTAKGVCSSFNDGLDWRLQPIMDGPLAYNDIVSSSSRTVILVSSNDILRGTKSTFAIFDGFNRPNSTTSLGVTDSGNTWNVPTVGTLYGINGKQAYISNTPSQSIAVVNSGYSDCEIHVRVPVTGDGGFSFRVVDNNNNFVFANAGGFAGLYVRIGGTFTGLAAIANGSNNDRLIAVLNGTSIKVYRNGTLVVNVTNSNHLTAVNHGLRVFNSNLLRFDDFYVIP